jgi:hypothetical protein
VYGKLLALDIQCTVFRSSCFRSGDSGSECMRVIKCNDVSTCRYSVFCRMVSEKVDSRIGVGRFTV